MLAGCPCLVINRKLHCLWPSINVYQHSKKKKINKYKIKGKTPTRPTRFSTNSIGSNNRLLTQLVLWAVFECKSPPDYSSICQFLYPLFLRFFFDVLFLKKINCNVLNPCVRALSFTMISMGQYKNSSYLIY